MQTAQAVACHGHPLGQDPPNIPRWPLPLLRPKRAAYGVAGLRSGVAKETLDML